MEGRFNGKVALITGTGGSQGRVAALLFAKEGAQVIGCDSLTEQNRETATMVREAGGRMLSIEPVDLADLKQCQSVVDQIDKSFGRLDILYNNAASTRLSPVTDMSVEEWSFAIHNELDIMFTMTKSALPLIIRSGGGSIVNTSSIVAIATNEHGNFAHSAAKGGVLALTRTLAVELARHNIRVNAIAPGAVDNVPRSQKDQRERVEVTNARKQEWLQNCPMHRLLRPEEAVKAAMFLASDDASFITGTTLVIDGGYSAH